MSTSTAKPRHKIVSFSASEEERELIRAIVGRAVRDGLVPDTAGDRQSLEMDLTATHANGCPLDFGAMLNAERDLDFTHDIRGIIARLDRRTGKLTNFFYPRFSKREG